MRRWVWRVLLTALAVLALIGAALAADPATVTLDNGVVLTADGGNWKVTGYTGSNIRVVLPSAYENKPVTSVGASAFKTTNGRRITEVVFPDTITNVGDNAFENCINLKTVLFLPGSAAKVTIGKSAFSGTGVSVLVLPDNLATIGESAFANNTSLTKVTIPDSVTTIGSKAFANNKNLKTVYIPAALKAAASATAKPVSADAFANTQLESIHYGGSDKADILYTIFEAMPPGLWRDQVHLATDSTHVNPPTCEDNGQVMGGGFCRETGENQTSVCKSLAGDEITINALGHDYQEPEVDMTGHKDCETWTWEYTVTCSRCGAEVDRQKVISPTAEHTWADDGAATVTKPATCLEDGEQTTPQKCSVCGQEGEPKKETIPKLTTHTYTGGKTLEYPIRPATCSEDPDKQGMTAVYKVCDVCNKSNECEDCGTLQEALEEARKGTDNTAIAAAEQALVSHLGAEHGNAASDGYVTLETLEKLEHTRPEPTEGDDGNIESIKSASCTEEGEVVYKADTTCTVCGEVLPAADLTVTLEKTGHTPATPSETRTDPTCTEEGRVVKHATVCEVCGAKINEDEEDKVETTAALGHLWGDFQPDEGQDTTPNETCVEKVVTGTVTCTREGCAERPVERRTLTIEGLGSHNYEGSEWEIVKEATATEDGLRQRPCMNPGCTHMDEEVIPATGTPDDPEEPDDPDDPNDPTEPEQPATYRVDVIQASNGTTSVNRTTAQSGDRVTITVSPASDYELDMLRVISADGRVLNPDSLGSGQYRFTMPAANVEVRATFSRKSSSSWSGSNWASAPGEGSSTDPRRTTDVMPTQNPAQSVPKAGASEQVFRDISTGHWAAGEINWASQMGYMNGTGGRFNPDGNITHQQMWMVLARLTGNQPANMTEARRWAVEHSFADGSAPTAPVSRHQLVTALYRCAHLMGSTNRNTTSLAGYTDSRTVPTVARDAFAWAVANGIVSGTANGRLDPNGTLTRAQFAVILYRYSQRI